VRGTAAGCEEAYRRALAGRRRRGGAPGAEDPPDLVAAGLRTDGPDLVQRLGEQATVAESEFGRPDQIRL
jgi:hypothetical protein